MDDIDSVATDPCRSSVWYRWVFIQKFHVASRNPGGAQDQGVSKVWLILVDKHHMHSKIMSCFDLKRLCFGCTGMCLIREANFRFKDVPIFIACLKNVKCD